MELIVAGFHRSGASLATQMLHAAGLFVGDKLVGATPSDPCGNYEDREVVSIHRKIMGENGVGWQVDMTQCFYIGPPQWRRMDRFVAKRQSRHRRWGFSDPQVCFFLGAWKFLLPDVRFLIVYRDPGRCLESLRTSQSDHYFNGSGNASSYLRFFREPDHGLNLWDVHNRAVLAFARQHLDDCLVLPYHHVTDGYPVIPALNAKFRAGLDEIPTGRVVDPPAVLARERQLVHSRLVRERVDRTWRGLEELAAVTEVKV